MSKDSISVFDLVVMRAGGMTRLAQELGETLQVVSNWRSRGFPARRCKAIESLTGVPVQMLRPHDWHDYWPESQREAA